MPWDRTILFVLDVYAPYGRVLLEAPDSSFPLNHLPTLTVGDKVPVELRFVERQSDGTVILADPGEYDVYDTVAETTAQVTVPVLTRIARDALERHAFPGNVRELENILERAVALSDGGSIDADDLYLPDASAGAPAATRTPEPDLHPAPEAPPPGEARALEEYLGDLERQAILKALDETRWNRTAAARKLGMTLRSLRYRLAKLGID